MQLRLRFFISTNLILLWSALSYCQFYSGDLLNGKDELTIPFEYKNGFVILSLTFQDYFPMQFIFDTGAENTILFNKEITDILKIPYDRQVKVIGSDLTVEMYAHICRSMRFRINDKTEVTRDIIVLDNDNLYLNNINGIDVNGIVGGEFFKGLVVEINYNKKNIKVYHPDRYTPHKESSEYDIEIISNKPYIKSSYLSSEYHDIDTTYLNMLIDSGAAITFMLFTNSDSTIVVPDNTIPGYLGKGLGGDLVGLLGKARHIGFGNYNFDEVITYYQNVDSLRLELQKVARSGLIGNLVLMRFDQVAIDYTYSKLYLKPSKKYNKDFAYDKSGLNIYALGPKLDKYYIKSILIDSPAYEAGIRPGDLITKIGWWSTRWYTLESISNRLSKEAGKKIKLTIQRDGVKYKKSFILRDLLSKKAK